MSTSRFLAIFFFSLALYAQMPQVDRRPQARDEFAPDNAPVVASLDPDWPEPADPKPISGIVSLRELQHPVSNKAIRAAYEAQQLLLANKFAQAIAKLEKAIRIDPLYRDAHWNLGVQYARVGRLADACAEFRKALEIGPPAAPIYANLAFASAAAGERIEAQEFARKALELDPCNRAAQLLLDHKPH